MQRWLTDIDGYSERNSGIEQLTEWIHVNGAWLGWLAGISALTFVLSLALLPWLVAKIPVDYFTAMHRHQSRTRRYHPLLFHTLKLLKNAAGILLLVAGFAMLVLPGQGVLTLLLGLSLCDFPGKYRLERAIVRQPAVFRSINWLRRRQSKPPLLHPDSTAAEAG